jgi:hypothetical protein
MIKAYETETKSWKVYRWELGQEKDKSLGEITSVDTILGFAKLLELPVTFYSLEWYEKLQKEGEGNAQD